MTRLFISTAALALITGAAVAGDNNESYSVQDGDNNALSVFQNGSNNDAGRRLDYSEYLKQAGDGNTMTITQTGNNNVVAGNGPSSSGAFQTGDNNALSIAQTSYVYSHNSNGHRINHIRQNSGAADDGNPTNIANITQKLDASGANGQGPSAGHFINTITQIHPGGTDAPNTLTITQEGSYSAWFSNTNGLHGRSTQNNRIIDVAQSGSGNIATLSQRGTGPGTSQQQGPKNHIAEVKQTGDGHRAEVSQDGYRNYVGTVSQSGGDDNEAVVTLKGNGNGSDLTDDRVAGTLYGAAGITGAVASSVSQLGNRNKVGYEVDGGKENQFGFKQDGNDNGATDIYITGDRNHLGVDQTGDRNTLMLADIDGDDNVLGLIQVGSDNTATVTIDGDRNGSGDWSSDSAGLGLTAGLLKQLGHGNDVTLNVLNGNDNLFASLQDGDDNTIIATQQNGDLNQAAVSQVGNSNTATLSQSGSGNSATIQQGS